MRKLTIFAILFILLTGKKYNKKLDMIFLSVLTYEKLQGGGKIIKNNSLRKGGIR